MGKITIPEPFFKNLDVYSSDDLLLGTIFTETQFYEIRCQIKEQKLGSGYYFLCDGNKINMDEFGRINRNDVKHVPFKYESYLDRLLS